VPLPHLPPQPQRIDASSAAGVVAARARPLAAAWIALALVVLLAWFGSLELRGLFVPDEARYAEIPREMTASGDWITPRLNDLKYFEKPPLQYWMTAVSYRLFGEDEWTARLPSAMLGFFALLMLGFTGYRLRDVRTGLVAATLLGSSWAYFLAGQYLTLDMTLTACLTFALCAFLLAQSAADVRRRNAWMSAAWAAAALAVLAKGLVGVVLPAGALLAYLALRREQVGLLRRLSLLPGVAIFVAIAAPWFLVVQHRNPEFFHFFFVYEHLERFTRTDHHRVGAWWYYVPVLLAGMMPWTPALAREGWQWLRRASCRAPRQAAAGFSPRLFCVAWIAVIVVFFSVSRSKLPAYVLPAFPAIALLLAMRPRERDAAALSWSAWGTCAAGIVLLAAAHGLPRTQKFVALGEHAVAQLPWLYAAAAALLAGGAVAVARVRAGRLASAAFMLVIATLGFWHLVFGFLHQTDADFSSERLIEEFTDDRKPYRPEVPFYSVAQFDPSVPFYLGRTTTLVATRGELGPGIDAEPGKAVATLEDFERLWRAQPGQAYAVLRPGTFADLRSRGLPMIEAATDGRLVIAARHAQEPEPEKRTTGGWRRWR